MTNIEQMVAQGLFDRQVEFVGEHWAAVRRLWLGDSDFDPGAKIRSDLPPDVLTGCGMPGIANIKPVRNGRFEFVDAGREALIVPCYDGHPGLLGTNPERHVEELRDLVAVDLDHPDRFWRRRGKALVLGNAFLEIAGQGGEPTPVFKTPLSWLRSGGAGICILDWDWTRELLLDHELIAEDIKLGDRLAAALRPEIWVMEAAA